MLADLLAVIGGEDNDGVLGQSRTRLTYLPEVNESRAGTQIGELV